MNFFLQEQKRQSHIVRSAEATKKRKKCIFLVMQNNELLPGLTIRHAAINTFMDNQCNVGDWMDESYKGVDDVKFKVGKVYSGYYDGMYIAFEVVDEFIDCYKLDITACTDEKRISLGIRDFYKYFNFFKKGRYTEVATDYTQAKIDLLLKLRQKDWFLEEVGGGQ